MYECEECEEKSDYSKYNEPIIVESKTGKKMLIHPECCSTENLIKVLGEIAESERLFYDDVLSLVRNCDFTKLQEFEQKYGTYDEIRSGISIDRFKGILAIVTELKSRHLK
ncbi:MAG: hypothetical protein HY223_03235 [Thaumarchaeota archaeon]|nr:hypothetical protein [Nitrososphaerota archaeon]